MSATRRLAVALAGVLVVAACSSSGDDETADDTTPPTAASPDATADADPEPEPAPEENPAETGTTGDAPETTEPLTPSEDLDLPTERPDATSEPVPVTTLPGPLPQPSVRLLEVGTFSEPVEATFRDLDSRLVVVERRGQIIAFDDESSEVVLDIDDVDATSFTAGGSEQGMLGLAFHPEADVAYVDFIDGNGNTVLAEFAIDPVSLQFDPGSYREVLRVEQPFSNHNGGELAFGPDGHLYLGLGDGGAADDPERNGLDLSTRLGKILRIDPLETDGGEPFAVPADNPFVDTADADPTIWSYGLRNPWKFSFDSLTGDLWIADVGQNEFEEVSVGPATNGIDGGRGLEFGWSAFEAFEPFNGDQSSPNHWPPAFAYPHADGDCSVSGGVVARSSSFEDLNGWYVYGDFCSGRLWALDTTSVTSTADGPVGEPVNIEIGNVQGLAAVVDGPDGDVYAISFLGPVYRLAPT